MTQRTLVLPNLIVYILASLPLGLLAVACPAPDPLCSAYDDYQHEAKCDAIASTYRDIVAAHSPCEQDADCDAYQVSIRCENTNMWYCPTAYAVVNQAIIDAEIADFSQRICACGLGCSISCMCLEGFPKCVDGTCRSVIESDLDAGAEE